MKDESEGMWKEVVVGYFKVLPQCWSGGTEEKYERPKMKVYAVS